MRKRPNRTVPLPLATPTYAGTNLDRAFSFEICATGVAAESPGSVCACRRPALGSWGRDMTEDQLIELAPPPCARCKLIPPIPWSRMPNHAATTAGAALVRATGLAFRLQERKIGDEHEIRFIAEPEPDSDKVADTGAKFDLIVGRGRRRLSGRAYLKLREGVSARGEDRGAAVARAAVAVLRVVRAGVLPPKPGDREHIERQQREAKADRPEVEPPKEEREDTAGDHPGVPAP